MQNMLPKKTSIFSIARLAQSAERKALNLVVVGSSPTVGVLHSFSKLCCLFAESLRRDMTLSHPTQKYDHKKKCGNNGPAPF